MHDDEEMLNEDAAGELLGLTGRGMRRMRADGEGPAWVRVGRRAVRYRRGDVLAYRDARRGADVMPAGERR